MKPTPTTPLTEDELHALVDGQVRPDELAELQARLGTDTDGQTLLRQWQGQRAALRRLYLEVLDESAPQALLQAVQKPESQRHANVSWQRLGGMVASVVLAFGAGWLASNRWQATGIAHNHAPQMARLQLEHEFVHQASVAHSVYTPEVRHPVEVTALEQAHLVQWLSKRLGRPLKVPDLTALGFELVGGRLLPGDSGARAQFMFQNRAGNRVTLYLGAMDAGATAGQSMTESGFRYEADAAVPSFYWMDQGFGYALAGQLPREVLMKLADAVYQQL